MELNAVKAIAIYGTDCVANIVAGDGDTAQFISAKEKYFDINVDDGMLTVRQKSRNLFYRLIMHRIEFKIVLPRTFRGKLRFRNKNGGLYIDGGAFTDVELSTDNGKFEIRGATCASFQLRMQNGAVTAKNLTADDVAAIKCVNGSVRLESVSSQSVSIASKNASLSAIDITTKKFECTTSNGPIDASGINADDMRLETSNGKICAATLGVRDDYKLSIDTEHGTITVDGVAYKRLVDATKLNKKLSAKTANGDIDIRFV